MITGLFHLAFVGPGGPEILVVMLALLVMFGAKDAPRIFRKLNDILTQIRSTAENFKREVMYGDIHAETSQDEPVGEYDDYGLSADEEEKDEPVNHAEADEGEDDEKPL